MHRRCVYRPGKEQATLYAHWNGASLKFWIVENFCEKIWRGNAPNLVPPYTPLSTSSLPPVQIYSGVWIARPLVLHSFTLPSLFLFMRHTLTPYRRKQACTFSYTPVYTYVHGISHASIWYMLCALAHGLLLEWRQCRHETTARRKGSDSELLLPH